MKLQILSTAAIALLCLGSATADDLKNQVSATLKGAREVPFVSSGGSGTFKATIDDANQTITYELTYTGITTPVAQAHIHLGQPLVSGGVSLFLCGNPPTVPPATFPQPPACPPSPATVTGTLTPANIVGPTTQGIALTTTSANDFAELIRLILEGHTYANVHSSQSPSGEIRGQIHLGLDSDHDHDD